MTEVIKRDGKESLDVEKLHKGVSYLNVENMALKCENQVKLNQ